MYQFIKKLNIQQKIYQVIEILYIYRRVKIDGNNKHCQSKRRLFYGSSGTNK